jgi:hypothetical protein
MMANREAADLDFQGALDALREGIDGYGDRIHAGAAVLRATDDLDIETDLLTHPRVEQAIWRYEHDPDTIRQQIDLTIEREDAATTVDEVVAAFRVAAVRLDTPIATD